MADVKWSSWVTENAPVSGDTLVGLHSGVNVQFGLTGTWPISISGNSATTSAVALSAITGFGTGVETALSDNVGSAGSFIVNGGALGTPSSGTATNITGTSGITALGAQSQALNMNSNLVNNVTNPVNPQDAATKAYVDQTALTGTSVYASSAATLGTVTQSGAGIGATLTNAGSQATFALDGVNPPVGSSVLIQNTATGMTSANEGIYTVTNAGSNSTNWVLTRATDYDTPVEINRTGLIVVQNGTTLSGTAWYNTTTIVTVDTTAFSYSEFGNIVFPISLAHGGTNANLTAVAGGVAYSGASSLALSAAGTSGQLFQSAGTSAPGWTTSTYPSTNAINTIMYASSANVLSSIAAANSSVLSTSSGGVPSFSTTLPAGLTIPGYFNNIVVSFPGAGTFTPNANLVAMIVEGVGGGGGGGGTTASGGAGVGGGGGAGGYFWKLLTAAQCSSASVVIGSSGSPGASSGGSGGSGGNTTFTCTGAGSIVLTGNGGTGGSHQDGVAAACCAGGPGGASSGGDFGVNGQPGGAGFSTSSLAIGVSGVGGNTGAGFGVGGGSLGFQGSSSGSGINGIGFGSGGGGALITGTSVATAAGGSGGIGTIRVTQFIY
jgi:hypothetical protein